VTDERECICGATIRRDKYGRWYNVSGPRRNALYCYPEDDPTGDARHEPLETTREGETR